MDTEEKAIEAFDKFSANIESLNDSLDILNALLKHYIVHVHDVRLPNEMQKIPKETEH